MAESGMVGADTSIYNKLMQPQPQNDLGHLVGIANAAQQNQLLQAKVPLEINNAQLENSAKHLDYVNNYLAPLIALGPKVGINDLTKAASDAAANSGGAISQQEANNFVQQIVTNPNGIQPALQQMHMRVLDAQGKIAAIRGVDTTTNVGGSTQLGNRNAFTGAYSPAAGGTLQSTLTPGERTQQQDTFQNGQKGTRSVGSTFDDYGNMRPVAPSPGQTPATSMAPAGMAPSTSPVAAAPSAFNPTAPALGVEEAATKTAGQSAEQGGQLQALADAAPLRKARLAEMEQMLGQTNTGPIAGALSTAGALGNEILGNVGSSLRIPGVADKERFMQVASELQAAQAGALGGTDAAKSLAGRMKPNIAFSTEGNRQIIQNLKGQEDAIAAKNSAWQEWKKTHGPDTFGAFQEDFNKHYEPRAFMAPYMSKEERAKLVKNMTPDEKASLHQATQTALDRGWINPPKD